MSTRGWTSKEINGPRGAWTASALQRKGHPQRASVATNMRFKDGRAYSREGTSVIFTPSDGAVSSMYNWISPSANELVYLDGTVAKRRRLSDGTPANLLTGLTTTQALSFAELGPRLYFCGFTTANAGTIQARVWDGASAVDSAFRAPLTVTSITAVDGGAGQCTRGLHYFGFIFQSRSGFAGKPSPVNGSSVFVPASVTLNAQQRTVTLTITLDTPADAGTGSAIYPIMTRASNPNIWYFVPDAQILNPTASAAGYVAAFTISVSDEDLAARAETADNQFNLLTQTAGGSGPFTPNFVASYGKRMAYGVGNKVYFSDIDDPQAVTEDFNVRQIAGQQSIVAGVQFGQDFYYFGDKWTARDSDNGDAPATWSTPSSVSSSLGAPFPDCIEWRTNGPWMWIANPSGLYLFNGAYPQYPISFEQSDIWARINWAAGYCVQIADDVTNLRVHVAVPLDAATAPSHVLVYDYGQGMAYDRCDFSLDNFAAATFGSIRAVKESATNKTAVYIGPAAAGRVLKLDTATHNDVHPTTGTATAIGAVWESSYIRQPGELQAQTIRVGNADLWIRGDGALTHTWKGFDGTPSVTPTVMSAGCTVVTDLASTPGAVYQAKADIVSENCTFRFSMNAVGAWFELSGFRPYYRAGLWTR
jgi:hypothetical protein